MKILKNSVVNPLSACLLFALGGGGIGLITYVTYATSCTNSTPAPTPTQLEPIPFTDEYFTWTTDGDELTITGLQDNIDLSNYDTLQIPATCVDGGIEYRITTIDYDAFYEEFSFWWNPNIINLDLVNATNLQVIDDFAFEDCSGFTGSLIIPNSVTTIDYAAFRGCSGFTGTLTIGNWVTDIGNLAFLNTKFTNVINYSPSFTFADNVGNAKVLIPASSGTSLDYENGSAVGCIAFGQLTIPFDVTTIGMLLFFGCSAFTGSLTIPNSVDSIGMGAFRNCSGFTGSLTIPDSVTLIEMVAFQRCSGFKIIDISSWTDIPTILSYSFDEFNPEGGTVLVPENYVQLGIALSTFDGLPSTWQLQVV